MRTRFRSAVIIILVAGFSSAANAQTLHKVLASPLVEEGSGPDGCTPAVNGLGGPSAWEVRVERYLLDGKGLVEVTRQADANRFPLCIADLPVAKNAEVELSFVAHAGTVARTAGIVLRFADPQDFYAVEADVLGRAVRLIRVLNGERREIAIRSASLQTGAAQSLKVTLRDEAFAVSLNGVPLFEARDDAIAAPGRFGVWSKADSATLFGDLFITVLD
ncbi:MAG TPA: hypothetical protein VH206_14010 [Xanthobacteraceae bacterium]|nr:hypothetical protein [Xanthobacteraceae bacterium]